MSGNVSREAKWNTATRNRSGICHCGQQSRPGQGYCWDCHAAANRMYRQEKAKRHAAEHRLALAGIAARSRTTGEGGTA